MSNRLPAISGQQLIRALLRAGFRIDRQVGSHVTLVRANPESHVTIPNHGSQIVGKGLLASILRDIEMTVDELKRHL
jgi:predicted RNA binding protein YcfA (HicA-like mRNA interferase family)